MISPEATFRVIGRSSAYRFAAFPAERRQLKSKARRPTYSRQAVPACSGGTPPAERGRRDALPTVGKPSRLAPAEHRWPKRDALRTSEKFVDCGWIPPVIELSTYIFEVLRKDESLSFTEGGVRMSRLSYWSFRRWRSIPRRKV